MPLTVLTFPGKSLMKNLILIFTGILVFIRPAFPELSDSDLQRLREIVKVEVVSSEQRLRVEMAESEQRLRAEMTAAIQASEERLKVYVDAKISEINSQVNSQFAQANSQFAQVNNRIDEVDKRINFAFTVLGWLFALVIAALGIPQLIIAFRQRGQERLQTSVEELYAVHSEVLAELKQLRAESETFRGRDRSQPESP